MARQAKWGWRKTGETHKLYINSFDVVKVRRTSRQNEYQGKWSLWIKDMGSHQYGAVDFYFNTLSMAKEWAGDFVLGGYLRP